MKNLFLLFFCCFLNFSYAQNIAELKRTITTDTATALKIESALKLSTHFSSSNLDSALYYTNVAENFSKLMNDKNTYGKIRAHKAGILINQERFTEADSLLRLNIDSVNDSLVLGMSYTNLGVMYQSKNEYDAALSYHLRAIPYFEALQDSSRLGNCHVNMGTLYARLGEFEDAIFYFKKAIPFFGANERFILLSQMNLAAVYTNQKKHKKGLRELLKAEALAEKNNLKVYLSIIYGNLNSVNTELGDYTSALTYGFKSLQLKKELHLDNTLTLNNIGYAYLKKGDYQDAITYFDQALPIATGKLKSYILNNLKNAYLGLRNHKKAMAYFEKYDILKDSLHALEQTEKVAAITQKYESEKKQQQINSLHVENNLQGSKIKQQNRLLWSFTIIGLLIFGLTFLGFRNYKARQNLKRIGIQQKLLQTQLNPHFLFHSLNGIQNYIFQNKKEESAHYLHSFSKLMRVILESSDQDFITVEEDSEAIRSYLNLQQLNFNQKFRYEVIIDETIETQYQLIPPMFTQPFVENAILHGLKNMENGHVKIAYTKNNNDLKILISDNGKGIKKQSTNVNKFYRSMSTEILKQRIDTFKTTKKYSISYTINSSESGTEVVLYFPTRLKNI